jgi:hypothetical protein
MRITKSAYQTNFISNFQCAFTAGCPDWKRFHINLLCPHPVVVDAGGVVLKAGIAENSSDVTFTNPATGETFTLGGLANKLTAGTSTLGLFNNTTGTTDDVAMADILPGVSAAGGDGGGGPTSGGTGNDGSVDTTNVGGNTDGGLGTGGGGTGGGSGGGVGGATAGGFGVLTIAAIQLSGKQHPSGGACLGR